MASEFTFRYRERLSEEFEVNPWARYAMRLGVAAAMHPLDYSKTLMKIGFEPIPTRPGKNMFGKPILILPNIFQYASHIRQVDGFFGCYRGLAPKMLGSFASILTREYLAKKLNLESQDEKELVRTRNSSLELYQAYVERLKRDLIFCTSGIIVSHPFRVISVRMMAQFVGREKIYKSILGSAIEIWKTEGILGFFDGIVPQLIGDVACVVLSSTVVYLISKYYIKDGMFRICLDQISQAVFSSIFYPLQVVSTCMIVNDTRLKAGNPPLMPIYRSWYDCYQDLLDRNDLKRGSTIIWRYSTITPRAVPSIGATRY